MKKWVLSFAILVLSLIPARAEMAIFYSYADSLPVPYALTASPNVFIPFDAAPAGFVTGYETGLDDHAGYNQLTYNPNVSPEGLAQRANYYVLPVADYYAIDFRAFAEAGDGFEAFAYLMKGTEIVGTVPMPPASSDIEVFGRIFFKSVPGLTGIVFGLISDMNTQQSSYYMSAKILTISVSAIPLSIYTFGGTVNQSANP